MSSRIQSAIKWILTVVVGVLTAVVQRYVFSRLPIFGVTPILMGSLAVVVGMYNGAAAGAVFGAAAGMCMYEIAGGGELMYAAVYAVGGFAAGLLCENLFKRNLGGAMLASLATNAVACLFFFILIMWIPGRAGISAMLRVGLPEIAYSTALTPLTYAPVRLLNKLARPDDD